MKANPWCVQCGQRLVEGSGVPVYVRDGQVRTPDDFLRGPWDSARLCPDHGRDGANGLTRDQWYAMAHRDWPAVSASEFTDDKVDPAQDQPGARMIQKMVILAEVEFAEEDDIDNVVQTLADFAQMSLCEDTDLPRILDVTVYATVDDVVDDFEAGNLDLTTYLVDAESADDKTKAEV